MLLLAIACQTPPVSDVPERPEVTAPSQKPSPTVRIPAGQVVRGAEQNSIVTSHNGKGPETHEVAAFILATAEVTQADFRRLMGSDPSTFPDCGACPVDSATWHEAVAYANALSVEENLEPAYTVTDTTVVWNHDANGWRLPTEIESLRYAELERDASMAWTAEDALPAKRGRNGQPRWVVADEDDPAWQAWARSNKERPAPASPTYAYVETNPAYLGVGQTHPVCTKAVDSLGLCDVDGNVDEWLWTRPLFVLEEPFATTEDGPVEGDPKEVRLVMGTCWLSFRLRARHWRRPADRSPFTGFRLARNAE